LLKYMRRVLVPAAVVLVAMSAAASVEAAASDVSVTVRSSRGGSADWSRAPLEQQPACIVAIGGLVTWSAEGVEHANALPGGLVNISGSDRVTFTAGDYTATVNFSYHGQRQPDPPFGEVVVITRVDVDLVSSTTGDVVRTTWRFYNGANVGDFGLAPFSLALPNYTDVTCRDA
jgi:hypothetical protein